MKRILLFVLLSAFCFSGMKVFSQAADHIVISEVYGGGGNTGSKYKNDFIELYNPTPDPVLLTGWSIQYSSSAGTIWTATNLSGSIASKGYYLIQEAAGVGGTDNLPVPNATGNIAMSATAGKIALLKVTAPLSGASPSSADIIDLVGFGTSTFYEGTGPASAPSATTSIERKASSTSNVASMTTGSDVLRGNSEDSNINSADFIVRAPEPQNSSSNLESLNVLPAFTDFYPKGQKITTTSFRAVVNLNSKATVYVVIQADGLMLEPTPGQVKLGLDHDGNAVANNLKTSVSVPAGATDVSFIMSGLTHASDYNVFFVASNLDGTMPDPFKVEITTLNPAITTPPVFNQSYPRVVGVVDYAFTVVTKITKPGNTYFVVLPDNAPVPSSAQVKAGTDASGTAMGAGLFGTMENIAADAEYQANINVLTASTAYDVYFVAEDNTPNLQAVATKVDVTTTIPPFIDEFTGCVGVSTFTQYSVTGDQVWGCTDFGRGSTGVRMNGFSGVAVVNEDWLISPLLNLQNFSELSFFSQFSFAGNPLKLMISTNYIGSGAPSAATWTDLNAVFPTVPVGSTSTSLGDWSYTRVDLAAYSNQKIYVAFVYTSTAAAAARWTLDRFQATLSTATYITTSVTALKNFGYISFPAASASKSFNVTGQNVTSSLTISAPANFEVSKDGIMFSGSITFTATEVATSPNVFVRFKPSAAGIGAVSGSISVVSAQSVRAVRVNGTEGIDPRSTTFDITAYNLEFFGTDIKDASNVEFGPTDDALQVANVTTVLETIGSDIYGVEEIADDAAFNQLVANLPGYSKIVSPRWSYFFNALDPNFPPQKIGFIYNTNTVQILSSRVMFSDYYDKLRAGTATLPNYPSGTSSSFWSSGRLPFMIKAKVTINGVSNTYTIIDIHAKSGSASAEYDRRQYDVKVLHDSLNANYPNDNIILLGDYNDDVVGSIYTGHDSSFKVFVDDASNYNILTSALTLTNATTFPNSNSFLDHILTSNELSMAYITNSIAIEDPRNYIVNYINTTSDHLPITARFVVKSPQTITFNAITDKIIGDAAFALISSASSTLPVTFTTTSDKITLTTSQVTIIKAGRVTITANQSGNNIFFAALPVDQSFCIKPAKPIVTSSNLNTETPVLTSNATAGNQWYQNGVAITGATNSTFNVTTPGIFKVQVKADDCVSAFSSDIPIIVTGDLIKNRQVVAYPNPATDYIEVSGIAHEIHTSQVINMMGQSSNISLLKNGDVYQGSVENLSTGVYLLRIQDSMSIHQIKFVKK